MEFELTSNAHEVITKATEKNNDLAIGLYAIQQIGWGGGYIDVAVALEEKKIFAETYKERFNEVCKITTGLPIYIDKYAKKLLQNREKVTIDAYGWSFTKHLGLEPSARQYIGRGGGC